VPYLKDDDRRVDLSDALDSVSPETPGELNYVITQMCLEYLAQSEGKYADYNTIIGALESAKLEFYARAVRPYEDRKITENGDVY